MLLQSTILADQTRIANYTDAKELFFSELYNSYGETFYCREKTNNAGGTIKGFMVNIELIYDRNWMIDYLECTNTTECRKKNKRFSRMESDLHNMFPVVTMANISRASKRFSMSEDNDGFSDKTCYFDRKRQEIEPPDAVKGDVARSIFYMSIEYNLPIALGGELELFKLWNHFDPPSAEDKLRNDLIERLQGTRNKFIDNPDLAERL